MPIIYHPEKTRSFRDMGWIKLYQGFHPNRPPAPDRRNFGVLVVFDNGHIMPGGKGFGMHPHDNMEIVSVVIHGAMVHSDTAGHNGVNVENAVQLISAGTGIEHSEYNYSETEEIDNLQIWFLPRKNGLPPRYQTMQSDPSQRAGQLQLLVSPDGESDSLLMNQDVWMWRGSFETGAALSYQLKLAGNGIYVFIIDGDATAEGQQLKYRDGLGITESGEVAITFNELTDILIIDVPMS